MKENVLKRNRFALFVLIYGLLERYKLLRLFRYGLVGVCAASAHALVAFLAHTIAHIAPTPSNFAGFITGAVISYLGSYYFTFKVTSGHKSAVSRFALVWIIGILVNVGVFKALLNMFEVPFLINVFVVIALTPILQFVMLRFWAFRHTMGDE